MRTNRVLICGTGYGATYIPALLGSENLLLDGIMARGSKRSLSLAKKHYVPFYDDIHKVTGNIDIACVAIGGQVGIDISTKLLQRGIPVLLEHPVSDQAFLDISAYSQTHRTPFHINAHFADLHPVQAFIHLVSKLNESARPLVINGSANSRTLYSVLDILYRCFDPQSYNWSKPNPPAPIGDINHSDYFSLNMEIDNIPLSICFQNWKSEVDDSRDSPSGHQLSVTYPQGVLTLLSPWGPYIWSPLAASLPVKVPIWSTATEDSSVNAERIGQWRATANRNAIYSLIEHYESDVVPKQQSERYLLSLTSLWSSIINHIGTSTIKTTPGPLPKKYWSLQDLLN